MSFNYTACLGLGGNLGDPKSAMALVLRLLDSREDCTVRSVSSLYKTPPWGVTDQPDFLNCCAVVETSLGARQLLEICLAMEQDMKRVRGERWGPRTIDIDVLTHSAGPVSEDGLEVPHPRMTDRAFVLVPLAEIAPDLEVAGKHVSEWAGGADAAGLEIVAGSDWWRK